MRNTKFKTLVLCSASSLFASKEVVVEEVAAAIGAGIDQVPAVVGASLNLVLLGADVIKSDQNEIKGDLTKIDARIHANAVQCILHAQQHGDTSLMRRLLLESLTKKSGYRVQGMIAWMREYTPMELVGDLIKLTGTINGERRPWRIKEANETAFWNLDKANEMVALKPIFRDNVVKQVAKAVKDYTAAVENTITDQVGRVIGPKDPKKPFYNGIHLDKVSAGFGEIKQIVEKMAAFADATKDAYDASEMGKKAALALADANKAVEEAAPEAIEAPAEVVEQPAAELQATG